MVSFGLIAERMPKMYDPCSKKASICGRLKTTSCGTMTTPYHAKYFAHELTRQHRRDGSDRLSMALFDACVDLNPHQIEAALFALRSPLSKGAILCDEVGLGKTVEAGLVLCQSWAERKRRLMVICPASLRKQWSQELEEKFNLPCTILDARSYRLAQKAGHPQPFDTDKVIITSFNFASRMQGEVRALSWALCVIDEAHKLRNAYRPSNKMGRNIRWALEDRKKILLTATPLQNSLLELYGLSTILDEKIFGDVSSFRTQYTNAGADLESLRDRIAGFCKRTLRRQVIEYIQYTERRPITLRFRPTDDEQNLYTSVSEFLMREDTLAIPPGNRHLTTLILRKLLASSSHAVANTLETMKGRLEIRLKGSAVEDHLAEDLIDEEELEDEYLDAQIIDLDNDDQEHNGVEASSNHGKFSPQQLQDEIKELGRYAKWARSIGIDTKSRALLKALDVGFEKMDKNANRKALIFTESRRTQDYLKHFLESNGYRGQIVLFNGSNNDPDSRKTIERWVSENAGTGRVTGSKPVDGRTALIENFRDEATIMIATEAAAEGVNLQFCSLVINYDLPWNPQRIEQRIGRCHRYGQKHDVVVINFLNERNEADRRVYELLDQKFHLFDGVFGASDEVLGQIESGVDFEKRILAIYQQCRSTEEINSAFAALQTEMEQTIKSKMDDTKKVLLEHFDEDVHDRLKIRLDNTRQNLDRIGRLFWTLTRFILTPHAQFDDQQLTFELNASPSPSVRPGSYRLISKTQPNVTGEFLYRLSHPLGQHVIEAGKQCESPIASVTFDVSGYGAKLSLVESLKGKSGWLTLQHLTIDSFDREEHLLFSAVNDDGTSLDQETCERLFYCDGKVTPIDNLPKELQDRLKKEANRHAKATTASSLESNNRFFNEERERLEKWADDMVIAAEKELSDTKTQIKVVRRQARLATTLDEQHDLQQKLKALERKQRKQRQQIFDIEDEIADKRDTLIGGLEQRMSQQTKCTPLFTMQWNVI